MGVCMRSRAILAVVAACAAGVSPAGADELVWRSASVQGPREPGLNTRLGVAIFDGREPATTLRRVRPAAPPVDGRLTVQVEQEFRFADGSTLALHSTEVLTLTPQGQHAPGPWEGEGRVAGGSGRFAGAGGTFRFRAVMGLDGRADGVLGDGFLEGRASVTLPAR